MSMTRWKIFLLFAFGAFSAQAQKKQVLNGNKLYEQKNYKKAAEAYQQALTKNPSYVPGLFNLGNAMYQQKNFDATRKLMDATVKQADDKRVKADASYNIGNTYMSEKKWEEAAAAYKQALRLNPQDEAAKYNLSYAQVMMKKNQKDGGGKNKNQDKDQKQDQQNRNENQNKDQQQNKEQNESEQNQQQDKKEKDEQQNQKSQPQPSKLSKEQADQLLNALSQEEKKLHDKKEKGRVVPVKMDKDW